MRSRSRSDRGRSAVKRAASDSSAGVMPSSSSAAGRSSVISERRSPIPVVICSSASSIARVDARRGRRCGARPRAARASPASCCSVSSWSSRAQRRALGLGGLDAAPQRLLARVLGGRHRGRRAGRERLQQPLVLLVERPRRRSTQKPTGRLRNIGSRSRAGAHSRWRTCHRNLEALQRPSAARSASESRPAAASLGPLARDAAITNSSPSSSAISPRARRSARASA